MSYILGVLDSHTSNSSCNKYNQDIILLSKIVNNLLFKQHFKENVSICGHYDIWRKPNQNFDHLEC